MPTLPKYPCDDRIAEFWNGSTFSNGSVEFMISCDWVASSEELQLMTTELLPLMARLQSRRGRKTMIRLEDAGPIDPEAP